MEKMTNAKAISFVLTSYDLPSDVREKLEKMLEQTQKRATVERKPTANQIANDGVKQVIVNHFAMNPQALTISEMIKTIPEIADYSNQRVSAIVRQMVEDKTLTREEVKRKAYFSLMV